MTPRDRTANGRFRILAVANETIEGEAFHDVVLSHAGGQHAEVVLVVPALGATRPSWPSEDDTRDAAELRLVWPAT